MTWLWILLGIIALFILLGLLFVTVEATCSENKADIYVRLGGVRIYRYVATRKMMLKQMIAMLKLALGALKRAKLRHRLTRLRVSISCGTGDAAEAALACGTLSNLIYTIIGIYSLYGKVDEQKIAVTPVWNESVFRCDAEVFLSARLGNIVLAIIRNLVYIINNRETIKYIMKNIDKDGV